jgi:hypothetical protein
MRCVKYVMDNRTYALRIRPKMKEGMFHLEGFSDCDYAGTVKRETRFSLYGYIVYFVEHKSLGWFLWSVITVLVLKTVINGPGQP